MPLHPVAQSIVDGSKQPNARPNAHLNPVPVARANFESDFGGLKKPEVGEVRDLMIKVRDGSEIRGRLYLPAKKSTKSEPPIVIYYHGGGWLLGSIDSHDACTRLLCLASDCAILSVDYRRGPESKFPTAVYDAVDSVKWAVTNAKELGVDKDKIAVAGDSAGGNLAAVVSIILRDEPVEGVKIAMQVLVYPVTTCDLDKGFDVTWEGTLARWAPRNFRRRMADLASLSVLQASFFTATNSSGIKTTTFLPRPRQAIPTSPLSLQRTSQTYHQQSS